MRTVICAAALLLALSLVAARPVVWQVQDPVQPGQTVMLFGDGFGDKPQVALGRVADTSAGSPGGRSGGQQAMAPVAVLQATDQCLKVLVPAGLKPGLFTCLIGGACAVPVNRPAIWWTQVEPGLPGSNERVLRLFGKNLAGPRAVAYLKGPKTVALPLGKQDDTWAARVSLPADLPVGDYQVCYHSGFGGPAGWSDPVVVSLTRPAVWPTNSFSLSDFGADGSGGRDDTEAFNSALAAAEKNGGGVVFVPRGRYQITGMLKLPRFTVLRGESADQTALFWPDMATPPEALIQGTNSFALENLTIYASKCRHVIVGDLGDKPDSGNVRLWRVRTRVDAYRDHLTPEETDERYRDLLRISGGASVRLGGDNIVIAQCDFYGSGMALYLSRTRNGVVRGNAFYNGRGGWYEIAGSDGLIFEDNTITGADLAATGGGLDCLDGSSYSQNVYFSRNKLELMHGWDREAMTSDAGGGLYYGPIAGAEGVTLTLPEAPKMGGRNWAGAAVFVFKGKGWTQVRRVVKVDGDRITVDRPWDVPPDSTSLVGITMMQRHYILADNAFSDAGIAIQFYGTSLEHIVSGNTCARAGGYQGIGKPYGGYQLPPDKNPCHQPCWFCQYVNNTITEGSIYRSGANNSILSGDSVIGIYGWPLTKDWPWPYNVGSVVRGNLLDNNARLHVGGCSNDNPSVSDAVLEFNTIRNADEAIRLDRAVRGILVRANTIENVRDPITGEGASRGTFDGAQLAAAERSRLRAAARDAGVTADPTAWPTVAQALAALQSAPPTTASQASMDVLTTFLTEANRQGVALSHATTARLLGFTIQVNKASTLPALLQKGGGGNATLVLDVSLGRFAPEWQVAAHIARPKCPHDGNAPVALKDGRATLTLPVELPATTWGRQEVSLHVGVFLPQTHVWLSPTLSVGTGQIRDWMVVGPFPNKSGQPLDLSLYPPEDALDLGAQYDSPAGKIKWQPVKLGNEWLNLNALFNTQEPGVAYAVAGIHASVETPAVLRFGSSGGVAVLLNGQYLTSVNAARNAQPDQDRLPLTLRAGDNVLLVKLSTNTKDWRFTAELTPAGTGFAGDVSIIPPGEFGSRQAFAPPPPRPVAATGEVRYPSGVNWQLAYADDFPGQTLATRWRAAVGQWVVHDGFVQSGGYNAFLAYAEKLAAPVRIEYDTRVVGGQGGDLSAFWLDDPKSYATGYLLGFGSNGNMSNKVVLGGGEVANATRPLVQPGKWHHVIAQILADGRVQLIVDDQLSIDYRGPAPGAPKFPGLWTWGQDGCFAKVRVYRGG